MSKIYRKAINKLSSSSSANHSDSNDAIDSSGVSTKSNKSSSSKSSFGSLRRKKKDSKALLENPKKSSRPSLESENDSGPPSIGNLQDVNEEELINEMTRKEKDKTIPEKIEIKGTASQSHLEEEEHLKEHHKKNKAIPISPLTTDFPSPHNPVTILEPSPLKAKIPLLESDKILNNNEPDEVPFLSSPQFNQSSLLVEEPDETQPLLLHQDVVAIRVREPWSFSNFFKSVCSFLDPRHPNFFHFLLLLAMIIAVIAYFTFIHISALVTQSVDFNLQNISISSINEDGVDSHVVGSIFIDYDNVSNFVYRNALKIGSLIIGGLTIIPNDAVKLYIKPAALDMAPMHVVDLYLPEITVDIFNKQLTQLDFITQSIIVEENMVKFVDNILLVKEEVVELQVQGVFASNISTKFFNVFTNEINIYESIEIHRNDLTPDIQVNTFFLNSTDTEIELSSNVVLNNNVPFMFDVDSIRWDILIHDCKDNMQQLGSWTSDPLHVRPDKPTSVDFKGIIDEVPETLLEKCKESGLSPFNTLIQNYIDGKPIQIAVRASANQSNNIPEWMHYVLHNLVLNLDVELPKSLAQVEVRDVIFNEVEMELPAAALFAKSETFDMNLKSNMTLSVILPFDLDFRVPRFKSKFTIKDSSAHELIQGCSHSFNYVKVDKKKGEKRGQLLVELNNIELNMLDPVRVGKYLNTNINKSNVNEDLYMDLEIDDLLVELPLFNAELTHLKLQNYTIPKGNTLEVLKNQTSPIDHLYQNMNVSIQQLVYVESTATSIQILCDFEMNNPTNFSVDIPLEIVEIGIEHSEGMLGRVTLEDVFIPKSERFNMTAMVEVTANSVDDKVNLEQFLSKFISESSNLTIGFTQLHLVHSDGLDELLEQISFKNVAVPPLEFDHSQEIFQQSPFFLGAAIHVLTSDVELTIFNPLVNAELSIDVFSAIARYENTELGHLLHSEHLIVPPGIFKTHRIPIKINQGIGMDVLKKAINGDLAVDVTAILNVILDDFEVELIYQGTGMKTQIRW